MSFPASLTVRTVKGRFVTHPDGKPAQGFVRIVLDGFMQGPTDDTFVAPFDRVFRLVDGAFSTMLPATNDPQWSGSFYRVYITVATKEPSERLYRGPLEDASTIKARLEVPYDSNLPIDLADVLNVPAGSAGSIYIVSSQRGIPGGIATLGDDGKVPASQLPPGTGGEVDWADVQNKPATFPPSAHTHPQTDVTGLVSSLSAKADASAVSTALGFKADLVDGLVPLDQLPTMEGGGAVSSVNGQTGIVVLTKTDVGLGNVTNTADSAKPVSTAQQTALDLKAPLASPTFTGTVSGVTAAMVGLGNVTNTADSAKPVSTAQQTALDAKAPLASPAFTGTVTGISKAMVGLGSVDNTADSAKPVSTTQQTALDAKAPLASPTFTGTVSGISSTMVGLGNVNNTADSAKPVSTAQQTALDAKADSSAMTTALAAKAPIASPTFTGTVGGITKSMVGLGNVDNTADTGKPVSTAQQTALDLKAPLASPTFTGTPAAPTPTAGDSTTKIATTAFVTTADNLKAPLASPTFTGTPAAPTAAAGTNTTQLATTAFVQAYTAKMLILGPDNGSNPVPGGTPSGTLIVRTT